MKRPLTTKATAAASTSGPVARTGAALLLALASLPAVAAGDWQFRPELGFELQFSTNPFAAREAEEQQDTGTASAALGVRLPVTRSTRRSSLGLTYAAAVQTYNRFSDLDSLDQQANLSWRTAWSRRSSFSLNYTLSWYTEQGRIQPEDVAEDSPVLVRRARITRQVLGSNLDVEMSRALDFNMGLAGSAISYEGLDAIEDNIQGARTNYSGGGTYRARVGLVWNHSPRTISEYHYRYQRISEDPAQRITEDGDELEGPGTTRDVHGLTAQVRFPAGREAELRVHAGVAKVLADEALADSQDSSTLIGGVAWQKTYRRGAGFQVGYAHEVGSSYGTGGASILRAVYTGYNQPFGTKLSGRVAANYTERTSVEERGISNERDTLRLNGEIVRRIGRTLGITLGARWIRQDAAQPGLVISDTVYRLGVRWYPRGWS